MTFGMRAQKKNVQSTVSVLKTRYNLVSACLGANAGSGHFQTTSYRELTNNLNIVAKILYPAPMVPRTVPETLEYPMRRR